MAVLRDEDASSDDEAVLVLVPAATPAPHRAPFSVQFTTTPLVSENGETEGFRYGVVTPLRSVARASLAPAPAAPPAPAASPVPAQFTAFPSLALVKAPALAPTPPRSPRRIVPTLVRGAASGVGAKPASARRLGAQLAPPASKRPRTAAPAAPAAASATPEFLELRDGKVWSKVELHGLALYDEAGASRVLTAAELEKLRSDARLRTRPYATVLTAYWQRLPANRRKPLASFRQYGYVHGTREMRYFALERVVEQVVRAGGAAACDACKGSWSKVALALDYDPNAKFNGVQSYSAAANKMKQTFSWLADLVQ